MRINLQIYDFSKNSKNWILRNKLRKHYANVTILRHGNANHVKHVWWKIKKRSRQYNLVFVLGQRETCKLFALPKLNIDSFHSRKSLNLTLLVKIYVSFFTLLCLFPFDSIFYFANTGVRGIAVLSHYN